MKTSNELLTAKEARKLMDGVDMDVLLTSIREVALRGRSLKIWYNLDSRAVENRKALGYGVESQMFGNCEKNTEYKIRW